MWKRLADIDPAIGAGEENSYWMHVGAENFLFSNVAVHRYTKYKRFAVNLHIGIS